MNIILVLLTALLSGLLVYVFCTRRHHQMIQTINNLYQQAEKERSVLQTEKEHTEKQLTETREQLQEAQKEMQQLRDSLVRAEEQVRFAEQKLNTQKEELESLKEQFRREFENLAGRILEEKTQKFTELNKTNLDGILTPFKEKIKAFEEKVEQAYKAEAAERNSLRGEINRLVELNQRISEEANQLAQALRADTRQQGNWGEMVLEKILEFSGLEKGREYHLQYRTENSQGETIRPDAVIFLPDNKHIIIDAKVSLRAYTDFVNTHDDYQREQALKTHINALKNHIRSLSEKYYVTARGLNTPDFILMFVPVESSFGAAIRADQEIFHYAWERKIVIVSPATLLATLQTIAYIWKQERQTRHARQIAEEGGKMYDKLVAFVEDLAGIGKKIEEAGKQYTQAMNKLTEGSGNLIRRAEKMKELGARVSKTLPQELVDRAE
jgi:DNA recombination protein RmuC